MGEDGGDGEAAGALDVHEEGTGSRHKGLFVEGVTDISQPIPSIPYRSLFFPIWNCSYLELVLAGLSLRRGVEEVDRENLFRRDIRQFNILSFLSIKISRCLRRRDGGDDGVHRWLAAMAISMQTCREICWTGCGMAS